MGKVSASKRLQIVSNYWLSCDDIMEFVGCCKTKAYQIKKEIELKTNTKSPLVKTICYKDLLEFLHIELSELELMAKLENQYM